jgi:hypothetical protein
MLPIWRRLMAIRHRAKVATKKQTLGKDDVILAHFTDICIDLEAL